MDNGTIALDLRKLAHKFFNTKVFILFLDMKCFLCQFEASILTLQDHYQNYHLIDPNEENLINLFKPNYFDDLKCNECQLQFLNDFGKKKDIRF